MQEQVNGPTSAIPWSVRGVLAAVTLALVWAPVGVSAHEKWFTDPRAYPVRPELFLSLPVGLALGAAVLALGALLLVRRLVGDPQWPNPEWLRPVQAATQAVIGIQTAISLIFMAVQGWLFSPALPLPDGVAGILLAAVVIAVSLSFVTGWFTRLGGAVLVGLVVLTFVIYPLGYALEQFLFAGIGVYFLILGRGLFYPTWAPMARLAAFWQPYRTLALPAARIGTGLSILVLAFTEKLLNPGLALAFLQTHPAFNFMHQLGLTWFTDELFVVAAGIVETTIGVLLIAGVLPRLVILLMWVPFNIAIPLLPPVELLGHLPILAVMYTVFLYDPGAEGSTQTTARAAATSIPRPDRGAPAGQVT
ncbi:MAG TPA: hypothetical protein VM536_22740 [Chloroflexia bacterium]|nr:hypothetical protein [Chloroflexia bacterium]